MQIFPIVGIPIYIQNHLQDLHSQVFPPTEEVKICSNCKFRHLDSWKEMEVGILLWLPYIQSLWRLQSRFIPT